VGINAADVTSDPKITASPYSLIMTFPERPKWPMPDLTAKYL